MHIVMMPAFCGFSLHFIVRGLLNEKTDEPCCAVLLENFCIEVVFLRANVSIGMLGFALPYELFAL